MIVTRGLGSHARGLVAAGLVAFALAPPVDEAVPTRAQSSRFVEQEAHVRHVAPSLAARYALVSAAAKVMAATAVERTATITATSVLVAEAAEVTRSTIRFARATDASRSISARAKAAQRIATTRKVPSWRYR